MLFLNLYLADKLFYHEYKSMSIIEILKKIINSRLNII